MIKRALLALLFFVSVNCAAQPEVSIFVTPNVVTIGDIVHYVIQIEMGVNDRLITAPSRDDFLENKSLEFKQEFQSDPKQKSQENSVYTVQKTTVNNRVQTRLTYALQVFDVGEQYIPKQQIILRLNDKKYNTVVSLKALSFQVKPLLKESDKTVKLPDTFYQEKLNMSSVIIIILMVLFCVIVLVFAWRYSQSWLKNRRDQVVELPDTRSIVERVNDELDDLWKLNYYGQNLAKEHYVRLSEILKSFLESHFGVHLVELTSTETLAMLETYLSSEDYKRLKHILAFSDFVKYAKQMPSQEEHAVYFAKARELVLRVYERSKTQIEQDAGEAL
jgi:hypothetical protein